MRKSSDNIINAIIQARDNPSIHRSRYLYRDLGNVIWFAVAIVFGIPLYLYARKQYKKRYQELCCGLARQREENLDRVEETPSIQIFEIGNDALLSVHHYEYCPELTAFIQVLTKYNKTKLYKRMVRTQGYQKFIAYQGKKFLLDENKIRVS